jgi:hypothetical protein
MISGQLSVKQAIEKIESGEIQPSGGANVEGHWM